MVARIVIFSTSSLLILLPILLLAGLAGSVAAEGENDPGFRAALREFLIAQNLPESIEEQMTMSLAQNSFMSLSSQGIEITEAMQAIILDEARASFGARFKDVEFLTKLYEPVYAAHYSEAEIRELSRFWTSPLGKKTIGLRTELSQGTFIALQNAGGEFIGNYQVNLDKKLTEAGITFGN